MTTRHQDKINEQHKDELEIIKLELFEDFHNHQVSRQQIQSERDVINDPKVKEAMKEAYTRIVQVDWDEFAEETQ